MSSRAQAEAPARLRYDALVPGGGPDHRADRPDQQRSPDDRFRLEFTAVFAWPVVQDFEERVQNWR